MRIAVAGLGFMGATHIKAIRKSSTVALAAVVSSDASKLAGDLSAIAGNLGGPGERQDFSGIGRYQTLDEALADPAIDAVDLCLPTDLHKSATLAALAAGKHVLVEKPMALDAAECDAMITGARQAGRVLMVAQVLRFFPMYTATAERLPSLGRMLNATFRRRCAAPTWGKWLKDKERSGGGVFDLLIHDVDMMLHLFGRPRGVSATGAEAMQDGIDTISARFDYGDGAAVTILGGWHQGAYPFSMEYSIVAEGGVIEYGSNGVPPTLYRPGAEPEALPQPEVDGYQGEIDYFGACCLEGRAPELCRPEDSALATHLTRLMSEARRHSGETIPCH
ncbi:MAG: Gfo/Idh/MocA family oxidoreductase [Acidobacteria bacterium]|nr:Gfo/Idh/MocA family oxidoreductase [Acidobacteriota bacterium]